jgi:hypothetical protein
MIVFYLLISAIYAGVFVAYTHSHRESEQLWEVTFDYRYGRSTLDREKIPSFTGEWTSFSIFLMIIGTLLWPLVIPAILVYKLTTKILNKNK